RTAKSGEDPAIPGRNHRTAASPAPARAAAPAQRSRVRIPPSLTGWRFVDGPRGRLAIRCRRRPVLSVESRASKLLKRCILIITSLRFFLRLHLNASTLCCGPTSGQFSRSRDAWLYLQVVAERAAARSRRVYEASVSSYRDPLCSRIDR